MRGIISRMSKGMAKGAAVNLRRRLLVFLLALTFTMIALVFLLLGAFRVLFVSSGEIEKLFQKELSRLSAATETQFGEAYAQAARLSENLSGNIQSALEKERLVLSDLNSRHEFLETLLGEQINTLLSGLDATDCSGVFLTLDATANPYIPGAENSKAGLYIRNVAPSMTDTRLMLRGYPGFAVKGLTLQARWDLEFDVRDQLFWREPLSARAANPSLPLFRLVYWCSMGALPEPGGRVLLCSVPLIDGSGGAFGVCGFEIGEMDFMLRHEPDSSEFHRMVALFSSEAVGGIRLEDALFSGNAAVYGALPRQGVMESARGDGKFSFFTAPDGGSFVGMDKAIRMYPDDSPFAGQRYIVSVLVPKADFDKAQNTERMRFVAILLALAELGIAASVFLSRRYVRPITDKLAAAGEGELPEKTNIAEIDLLLERFKAKGSAIPDDLFDDFINRVKTLTPVERIAFQFYVEGKTAEETQSAMYITAGTLRNHNTHIYSKLNVASREEMLLYISLLKKCGMIGKIFVETNDPGCNP